MIADRRVPVIAPFCLADGNAGLRGIGMAD